MVQNSLEHKRFCTTNQHVKVLTALKVNHSLNMVLFKTIQWNHNEIPEKVTPGDWLRQAPCRVSVEGISEMALVFREGIGFPPSTAAVGAESLISARYPACSAWWSNWNKLPWQTNVWDKWNIWELALLMSLASGRLASSSAIRTRKFNGDTQRGELPLRNIPLSRVKDTRASSH